MIRRVNGRSPPFTYVGLGLIIGILAFNYWTLSTKNSDLQQTVEKLQADVKIRYAKLIRSILKTGSFVGKFLFFVFSLYIMIKLVYFVE